MYIWFQCFMLYIYLHISKQGFVNILMCPDEVDPAVTELVVLLNSIYVSITVQVTPEIMVG
jgi:hypothetical protein